MGVKSRDAVRLEAAQMRFLWPVLGASRLDRQQITDQKKVSGSSISAENDDCQKYCLTLQHT
jgi:hypothetical protein